jgi:hypothetical protein
MPDGSRQARHNSTRISSDNRKNGKRRQTEKLIKVGPLEVPKRDNSREKLQLERRIGNAVFASARTNVWGHSDLPRPASPARVLPRCNPA